MAHVRSAQLLCLCVVSAAMLRPPGIGAETGRVQLKTFDVKESTGQILSYRYLGSSTDVIMRGTDLAPEAQIKLKVGSRPGFVELDINRGQISGLSPASQFGRDFLTYVLWAVSVDGKAANLGEIVFSEGRPVSINVTTPYQTFWLMLTAEPHFAVVDPSPVIVLYSASENPERALPNRTAEVIPGRLFFYTHYADYDKKPSAAETAPNALLQARKAVELASKSGARTANAGDGKALKGDEEQLRTHDALSKAMGFLARAEAAYRDNPNGSDVAQFSRTAAQIAENARSLALGAVGGAHVNQLEEEVGRLRSELSSIQGASPLNVGSDVPDGVAKEAPKPVLVETTDLPSPHQLFPETPTISLSGLLEQPMTWFGLVGWIVAILLMFRRRTI
jgi:hypothetical protein